jgi:Uma2 family endonuclease
MAVANLQAEQRVVLSGISWSTFQSLLADSNNRGTRFGYDEGHLEITSPSAPHERLKRLLARMIDAMTEELNIPIRSGGFLTLKSMAKRRGIEPDECYYVANSRAVRGHEHIDLSIAPPPDLAVEVDISSSSLDQLKIYASLGVPEVWLYHGVGLQVYQLRADGTYVQQARSPSFPFLPLDGVQRFLARRDDTDETTWIRSFRAWVKTLAR